MLPQHVDVLADEGREPGAVVVTNFGAVGAELGEGGVHVAGVEQHEGLDDESEGTDLVFLAFAVVMAQFAALPKKVCRARRCRASVMLNCLPIMRR